VTKTLQRGRKTALLIAIGEGLVKGYFVLTGGVTTRQLRRQGRGRNAGVFSSFICAGSKVILRGGATREEAFLLPLEKRVSQVRGWGRRGCECGKKKLLLSSISVKER